MTTQIADFYLDNNATTRVLPQAIAAATRVMEEEYGNPSSTHIAGLRAAALLREVRERATRLLGAQQGQVLFTSGATESIQTAVLSALCDIRAKRERGEDEGNLLLYGATEHKAVPTALAHWNRLLGLNYRIESIPVDENGHHDLAFLRTHAPHTSLVCTMAANNETGAISDLTGIEKALATSNSKALWLVDCVQALGKIPLDLTSTRIDYAAFSGHKLYAPKGIGLLYVRNGAPYTPLIAGGGQEGGLRSGTENMAGIAALGAVLKALEEGDTFRDHATLEAFREQLAAALTEALPDLVFNASFEITLPTTLNFSVPGFTAQELLNVFDAAGIRAGSGSACNSKNVSPSHVLLAMGLPVEQAASSIRLSFGPASTAEDIASACERIKQCGVALRSNCRIPSVHEGPTVPQGLTQFTDNGINTWILADAPSRICVIIDPAPPLLARIEAYVRCHDYQVLAILNTRESDEEKAASTALRTALGRNVLNTPDKESAFGWPLTKQTLTLGNKESFDAFQIGEASVARIPISPEETAYLTGIPDAHHYLSPEAVHYSFIHSSIPHATLNSLIGKNSLVCLALNTQDHLLTTLIATEEAANDSTDAIDLPQEALLDFLDQEPHTLFIDVREASEHLLSPLPANSNKVINIPLSRFAEITRSWDLDEKQRPLVVFCRSGARGRAATLTLRRLGYRNAWNLAGGVALQSIA